MKRSNFLKSLLIGIVAPKVVVEAVRNAPQSLRIQYFDDGRVFVNGEEVEYERSYGGVTKLPQSETLYSFKHGYVYKDFEKSTWQSL